MSHSPLAVTVLNLLCERPMHPYEMQRLIRERHLDAVLKLNSGSLYHAIDHLAASEFIEAQETQREGRRPERTVYAITDAGRDEFLAWLSDALALPLPEYPRFAAALAFLGHIDPAEAVRLLHHRVLSLQAHMAASDTVMRGIGEQGIHRIHLLEEEYAQVLRRAEAEWLRNLIAVINDGSLDGMAIWLEHIRCASGASLSPAAKREDAVRH